MGGLTQHVVRAVASAVEVIRVITDLRSRHGEAGSSQFGLDGETGQVVDVIKSGILDSYAVKQQVIRSSIESAAMLLRIDQIVSGVSHQKAKKQEAAPAKGEKDDDE